MHSLRCDMQIKVRETRETQTTISALVDHRALVAVAVDRWQLREGETKKSQFGDCGHLSLLCCENYVHLFTSISD